MTVKEIYEVLKTTGLPVAYEHFELKDCPAMPFICYSEISTNNYAADGTVYDIVRRFEIQLFTNKKDTDVEGIVEQALSSLFWQKDSEWNEDEYCYRTIYTIEI